MAFCMWGKPYAIQAHSSSLGKRLPDQQGKPKPAWAIQRWNTFLFYHFFFSSNASCKFQAILNDTPLPLPHTHTSRSGTIKTAVCLAWLSTCKNPLYNWTRTEQRMGTEAGRGSCHSALAPKHLTFTSKTQMPARWAGMTSVFFLPFTGIVL